MDKKLILFTCKECGCQYSISIGSFNPVLFMSGFNTIINHAKTHGQDIKFENLLANLGVSLGFDVEFK